MEIKDPNFKRGDAITFNVKGKIKSSRVVYATYVLPSKKWQYITELDPLLFIPEEFAVETPNHD